MFNCLFCVLEDLFLLLLSSGAVISQTQPNPLPPVSIPQHGVESREGMGKPPDPVRPAVAAAVTAAAAVIAAAAATAAATAAVGPLSLRHARL